MSNCRLPRLPQSARCHLSTLSKSLQLPPRDVGINRVDGGKRRESAVGTSDDLLPAHNASILLDPLSDELGMLDVVCAGVDHTWNQDLVVGERHLLEQCPIMGVPGIGGFHQKG